MSNRTRVFVYAHDAILQAGVAAQLRQYNKVAVVDDADLDSAAVALVVVDEIDDAARQVVKAIQRNGCPRVVLVAGRLDDATVLDAIEAGVCGLLRRSDATPAELTAAVESASRGDATIPPDVLSRLLEQIGSLQRQVLAPRGLTFRGLAEREVDVLKLVADGHGTAEIAQRLAYSERTVKNILHDVTSRLQLRNRAHAVAFALREGLI